MTVDGTKVTIAQLESGLLVETGINHTFVVQGPTIRLTSIEAPTFVPGEETTTISYAIDGTAGDAAIVSLKVWSAPPKGDRVAVAIVDLPGPYSASGTYDWDGTIDKSGKVITLKGSPYEVEFVLQTKVGSMSTSNKETIKLEIEKIEIVVDKSGALSGVGAPFQHAIDGLVDELKNSGMPKDCEGRLVIDSPVFKTDEMEMMYAASFTEYQAAVGNGPSLPFLAEITLKSKAGGGKRKPAALVGTRVLWDFKLESSSDLDGSLAARTVDPAPKAFIKKVASFEEADTQPKGVSAHMKAGGWRAKSADRDLVGRQWGAAGSTWKLTPPTNRNWSALTACGEDPLIDADSAVFFLPGRMAGDTHRVKAVVDLDETLDVADEATPDGAPAAQQSNTVKIVIWRRVQVVGNWIVGAGTVPVTVPPVAQEFRKAAMVIELSPGVPTRDVGATWKAAYQATVPDVMRFDAFAKDALESDPGPYAVRFREFTDYWQRANAKAGFFGKLWERMKNFFGSADEEAYKNQCHDIWYIVFWKAARRLTIPDHGITAMKFGTSGAHNQEPEGKGLGGIAPAIPGLTTRTKAIFCQFTLTDHAGTFIHELGHALFLSHAPGHLPGAREPDDYVAVEGHDKNDICLMSYDPRKQHLCGLCLLKLAGWNAFRIWSDGKYDT